MRTATRAGTLGGMGTEGSPTTLPPHPTLGDYYAGPSAKRGFLRQIFDDTAHTYDHVERIMAFGSGRWYRRQALKRAGLAHGMRVLDVAVGTGLVAREEIGFVGDKSLVTGLDPSIGMMRRAVDQLGIKAVLGVGEAIPLDSEQFDFLSMGYALRHLGDLRAAFGEFYRVLKPGGRVCVLEISRPAGKLHRGLLKAYMKGVVPLITRLTTRQADSQKLWEYYWETIEQCVPGDKVIDALATAGFTDVKRHAELGMFSEFTGRKVG